MPPRDTSDNTGRDHGSRADDAPPPNASLADDNPAGDNPAGDTGQERVGVRELRNQVAGLLRRAEAGDRIVITVDGRPTAQLGPVTPAPGQPTLDDLAATGLAVPPTRHDHPAPPTPEDVPVDVRPATVLDELRGGR